VLVLSFLWRVKHELNLCVIGGEMDCCVSKGHDYGVRDFQSVDGGGHCLPHSIKFPVVRVMIAMVNGNPFYIGGVFRSVSEGVKIVLEVIVQHLCCLLQGGRNNVSVHFALLFKLRVFCRLNKEGHEIVEVLLPFWSIQVHRNGCKVVHVIRVHQG